VSVDLKLDCDQLWRTLCRLGVGRMVAVQATLDSSPHAGRRRCSTNRCCGLSTGLSPRLHMLSYRMYTCSMRSPATSSLCRCSYNVHRFWQPGCGTSRCRGTPKYLGSMQSLALMNMVSRNQVQLCHWGSLAVSVDAGVCMEIHLQHV
jgi:hypothetical protein